MTMIPEEVSRRERLNQIREQGIDPYPAEAHRTHLIETALVNFQALEKAQTKITICGRLRAIRKHGGVSFVIVEDASGRLQAVLHRDTLGAEVYQNFHDTTDVGDYFEFTGPLFCTQKGEQSIKVEELRLLTKTLLPLPEKWHGLTDTETRYRQRYLDFIANPSVMNKAKIRSALIREIREYLHENDFQEVETPILQPIPGGAAAKPFITHHNTLHADLYLRIAPELYLKRLLVGGFEKVFEFARCFRNEGISPQHNPEFTQVELYWTYATIEDLMVHLEAMLRRLCLKVLDRDEVEYEKHKLSFKTPLKRQTFHDIVLEHTGIDLDQISDEAGLLVEMRMHDIKTEKAIGLAELIDQLYKAEVRPKIIQPTFITDYPAVMKPLAKRRSDPKYSAGAQLVVCGMEIWNGFNEMNDPLEQEQIFAEQLKLREQGSEEAQQVDQDFLTALKHGMPPAAGYGLGIDRLVAILTGSSNLKEVILFPTLKPKTDPDQTEAEV